MPNNALFATGIALPQIDAVGEFQKGQNAAQSAQDNQITLARKGLENIGSIALGAMDGDLNGKVDPKKFDEGLDYLGKHGIDVSAFKGRPDMAPVVARASLSAMQQLQLANDDRSYKLAMDKFQIEVANALKGPAPTDDQRELSQINTERKAAGQPELSLEDFLAGKKGNGITVTNPDGTTMQIGGSGKGGAAYDTAEGKGLYETGQTIAKEGRSGTAQLATLGKMKELLSDDKVYTGIGAEQVQQLQRIGANFGLDPTGIKDTESFNAMAKKSVLDLAGGSLGTGFRNGDRDYLDAQVPSLQNTKPGNLELIGIMEKVAQHKVDIAKFTADYKKGHDGKLDWQFDDALASWAEQHPIFDKPDAGSPPAAAGKGGDQVIHDWTEYGFDTGASQ
jgi:hypothetical protein